MRMRAVAVSILGLLLLTWANDSVAKPKKEDPKTDEVTSQARDEFLKGIAAVKTSQWSEALQHFEKAQEIKPSPVALFNIGYCQRALGRYVLAKASFEKALENADQMPQAQAEEARTFAAELDTQLARVRVVLDPPTTKLAVDGRPLVPLKDGDHKLLVAGVAPSGEGTTPRQPTFEVIIDPGAHLFTASFPGHANVLLNKSISAGSREEIPIKLSELPASIHVESDQARAVVTIDGRDVGLAPVEIARPAGKYRVQVLKRGFATYEATLTLTPGQKANLTARLSQEKVPITQKWWFWGGAAAVVAGGVTAAYMLSRPDPSPPPYNSGSLGWMVQPK